MLTRNNSSRDLSTSRRKLSSSIRSMLLISIVTLTIAGCAKTTSIFAPKTDWGGVSQYLRACDLPFRQWSKKDTDQTIREIKQFNSWKKDNCV